MDRQFAVIGSPIEHSKSPAIHTAAYKALGLNWTYEKREIHEEDLESFLTDTPLDGLSVTMPLKERAFAVASWKDPSAISSGTVNTMVKSPNGWLGYNTDIFGLEKVLSGIAANKVLILGAGATAKNAILALTAAMPSADLHIKTRNQVKADSIAEWALRLGVPVQKVAGNAVLPEYELVISTLPPLSSTDGWFNGKPKGTLLDVAYNPWPSELAKQWLSSGGNVISGIEMLIWQAIAQIRVFRHGSVAEPLVNEEEIAKVMRAAALAEG